MSDSDRQSFFRGEDSFMIVCELNCKHVGDLGPLLELIAIIDDDCAAKSPF